MPFQTALGFASSECRRLERDATVRPLTVAAAIYPSALIRSLRYLILHQSHRCTALQVVLYSDIAANPFMALLGGHWDVGRPVCGIGGKC
jgi:hypothetical protein